MQNITILAYKMREIRYDKMLTQLELSTLSGIPLNTIKNWELSKSVPNPKNFRKYIEFVEKCKSNVEVVETIKHYYNIIQSERAKVLPPEEPLQKDNLKDKVYVFR